MMPRVPSDSSEPNSLRFVHDIINSDKAVVIGKNARVEAVQEHE